MSAEELHPYIVRILCNSFRNYGHLVLYLISDGLMKFDLHYNDAPPVSDKSDKSSSIGLPLFEKFESTTTPLTQYRFGVYGYSSHSSEERPIFGSVYLYNHSDLGHFIAICHISIAYDHND